MKSLFTADSVKIVYNDNVLNGIVDESPTFDIFMKYVLVIRSLLYINFLKKSYKYDKTNLRITLEFIDNILIQNNKQLSKIAKEDRELLNSLKQLTLAIQKNQEYVFNTITVETFLNKYPTLTDGIRGFIITLLKLFYINQYTYTGNLMVPKLSYIDSHCFVTFIPLPNMVFSMKKQTIMGTFYDYFTSFKPTVHPNSYDDYKQLTNDIFNYFSSFTIPIITYNKHNQEVDYPIFNMFNIHDTEVLHMVADNICSGIKLRTLLVLYYNTNNLVELYDLDKISNLNLNFSQRQYLKSINLILTTVGNFTNDSVSNLILYYYNYINSDEHVSNLSEVHAFEMNHVNKQVFKELLNLVPALEADDDVAETDDEEISDDDSSIEDTDSDDNTPTDDDSVSESDDSDSDDGSQNTDESDGDDGSQNTDESDGDDDQHSEFKLDIDTEEPTLDAILTKIQYYKSLSQLIDKKPIQLTSSTKMLIYYWLRYWIFIVDIKITKKFMKRVEKELYNEKE